MLQKTTFYFSLCIVLLFSSCAPTINYSITSVAEEGGVQFTRLNNPEEETTVAPKVFSSGVRLSWDASPYIAIAPKGDRIAYIQHKQGVDNIYMRNTIGGSSVTQRTFSATSISGCSFSFDGQNIAYSDNKDGSYNIYEINANEGAAVRQIANAASNELTPIYTPDDKFIYYAKEERELIGGMYRSRYFIWNYDREKSILTQLIEGYTPNISPDGKSLIYTKMKQNSNDGEIWMMNIQSGTPSLIMTAPDKGFSTPQISPDGKKVLCVGTTNKSKNIVANLNIYVFNIDGTNLTQLTFNPVHDVSPRWSPDGNSIYFLSQRGSKNGAYSIWRMNFNK